MSVQELIKRNQLYLMENLDPDYMVDDLFDNKIISKVELTALKELESTEGKCRFLIGCLKHKSRGDLMKFCRVVERDFEWISEKLLGDFGENGGDAENLGLFTCHMNYEISL